MLPKPTGGRLNYAPTVIVILYNFVEFLLNFCLYLLLYCINYILQILKPNEFKFFSNLLDDTIALLGNSIKYFLATSMIFPREHIITFSLNFFLFSIVRPDKFACKSDMASIEEKLGAQPHDLP